MDAGFLQRYALYRLIMFFTLSIFTFNMAVNVGSSFTLHSKAVELNIKDNRLGDTGKQLNLNKIEDLNKILSGCIIAFESEAHTNVEIDGRTLPVVAVLTNSNYTAFSKLNILYGTFFDADACSNGRNVAVISESLAQKLYKSYSIIGREIELSEGIYRITGIYRDNGSLIPSLSSDGQERVFIPFQSVEDAEKRQVNTVLLSGKRLAEGKSRTRDIEVLSQLSGVDTALYKISDYYAPAPAFSQFESLIVFFSGAWIILNLLIYSIKVVRSIYMTFKRYLSDGYFIEVLKAQKVWLLKAAALLSGIFAFIVIIYKTIKFKIYIPDKYVPPDNIFDIGFYIERLKEAVHTINSSFGYIPSRFELEYANAFKLHLLLLACSVLTLIAAVSWSKLLMHSEIPLKSILKSILVSFASGILFSYIFAHICGLQFLFPVKELSIIIIFMLLLQMKGASFIDYLPSKLV